MNDDTTRKIARAIGDELRDKQSEDCACGCYEDCACGCYDLDSPAAVEIIARHLQSERQPDADPRRRLEAALNAFKTVAHDVCDDSTEAEILAIRAYAEALRHLKRTCFPAVEVVEPHSQP